MHARGLAGGERAPGDAMGWTSCTRGMEMMSTNEHGYRMIFVEVDVDTVAGMSGAPLVDAMAG